MKFLYLTDTHFTGKTPSSRIDDIQQTILNKLLDVKKIIEDVGIDIVLHGGDMFHSPDVSNQFTGKIAKIINSFKAPMYVVPGNHDLYGYNMSTINNTKLGLLEKTGVINIISRDNPIIFDNNGFKIGIEAQEYFTEIDEDIKRDFRIENIDVDFSILLSHSMLLDHKFHEGVKHTLIKDVSTYADLVLAGHYHDGFKERKNEEGTWFFNPGSFLRVDASTAMIKSMPRVVVFDIRDNVFLYEYIELPSAKPGSEVFSNKNLENKLYGLDLTNFHNKIKNQKFKSVNIIDLINEYIKNNPSDLEAAEYAKNKIESVSIKNCDKGYISESKNITIDKVELHNFQTHTNKVIQFENGLNIIVGESNVGKSSILRAIHWCLYDKPNGSDFIKTGTKSCRVIIHLSNGYIIERKRSRTSSGSYILTTPDGTVRDFKGFNNNIPIEILNAHQCPEIKINGTGYKINIAVQMDQPFLIGNSATERLSMLGAIVDADRADVAKRDIGIEKRRLNLEKNQLKDLKDIKEKELEKYNHLEKMKMNIEILEMAIGRIESDEIKLSSMQRIKKDYESSLEDLAFINRRLSQIRIPDKETVNSLKDELNNLYMLENLKYDYSNRCCDIDNIIERLKDIPNIEDLSEPIREYRKNVELLNELNLCNSNYLNLKTQLASSKFKVTYDLDLCKDTIEEFNNNVELLNKLEVIKKDFINLKSDHNKLNNYIISTENKISKLNKDKENRIAELQGVTDICESCGSEININKLLGDA